jgi:hypothetical protein
METATAKAANQDMPMIILILYLLLSKTLFHSCESISNVHHAKTFELHAKYDLDVSYHRIEVAVRFTFRYFSPQS